jgi:hypothetical protein
MLANKNKWCASVEWQTIEYSSSWKPDTAAAASLSHEVATCSLKQLICSEFFITAEYSAVSLNVQPNRILALPML